MPGLVLIGPDPSLRIANRRVAHAAIEVEKALLLVLAADIQHAHVLELGLGVAEQASGSKVGGLKAQGFLVEHPHGFGVGFEQQAVAVLAVGQLGTGQAAIDGIANAAQQLPVIELAFDQVISGAQFDGAGIQVRIALTGQQNDRFDHPALQGVVDQLQARVRAQAVIHQIKVVFLAQHQLQALLEVVAPVQFERHVQVLPQDVAGDDEVVLIIIDQQ